MLIAVCGFIAVWHVLHDETDYVDFSFIEEQKVEVCRLFGLSFVLLHKNRYSIVPISDVPLFLSPLTSVKLITPSCSSNCSIGLQNKENLYSCIILPKISLKTKYFHVLLLHIGRNFVFLHRVSQEAQDIGSYITESPPRR